jgi:hypothetical protein
MPERTKVVIQTKRVTLFLRGRGLGVQPAGDRTLEKTIVLRKLTSIIPELVEQNREAGQNPPRVVAPREEGESSFRPRCFIVSIRVTKSPIIYKYNKEKLFS